MNKEFKILSTLSTLTLIIYIFFPNIKDDEINENSQLQKIENESIAENKTDKKLEDFLLTFDIVRVSQSGETVIAGKSEPNISIDLLNKNKIITTLESDENGEWVWVSEEPLVEEYLELKLKYKDPLGNVFFSDQTIVVLNDSKPNVSPIVVKILSSNNEKIDFLNLEYVSDGLTLDLANISPNGILSLSGRTLSGHELNLESPNLKNKKFFSNENGHWSISFKTNKNHQDKVRIFTKIQDEVISLSFDLSKFNFESTKNSLEFKKNQIIVKEGNSLWRIARQTMGSGIFYSQIFKNNKKKIKNPDLIFPGQVFNIPILTNKISYE